MHPGRPKVEQGIAQKLRELRERLAWSQEKLATRSGLRRTEISIIEADRNKGTSVRVRSGLAKGFGVPESLLNEYWDGESPLRVILERVRAGENAAASQEPRHVEHRRSSSEPGPAGRYPNLQLAMELVVKGSAFDPGLVRSAGGELSSAHRGSDREVLEWIRLLESRLSRTASTTRRSPKSVPNLAAAIGIIAEDRDLDEDVVRDAAMRAMFAYGDPESRTTMQWLRDIERELDRPLPRTPAHPPSRVMDDSRPRGRTRR